MYKQTDRQMVFIELFKDKFGVIKKKNYCSELSMLMREVEGGVLL